MLQVKAIQAGYDGVPALHEVSFHVETGEFVTIIGSNGAGKSTILKTVSGLLHLDSGEIWFDEQRIDQLPAHEIACLGIAHVPEGRRLFNRLSVWKNLYLGAYTSKSELERHRRLDKVFAMFPRLQERRDQLAGTLSGGEQQMLAIGRGLMLGPRLLMLDEPSLGLMPLLVSSMFKIIQQINQEGTTVLLVEQNVRRALSLANRGYVLQTGRTIMEGQAAELLCCDLVRKAYLGI